MRGRELHFREMKKDDEETERLYSVFRRNHRKSHLRHGESRQYAVDRDWRKICDDRPHLVAYPAKMELE